jgi:hypothetical protein
MPVPQSIFGTCDGTGAAINVCLGFIPREVVVWNMEDAGGGPTDIVWQRQFSTDTEQDEGVKTVASTRAVVTSNGISVYNGGDEIQYDKTTSARWELTTGTAFPGGNSAEEVYVDGEYEKSVSGDAAYKCIGDILCPEKYHGAKVKTPKGFTIGTDADINADGEQLCWKATR